MLIRASKLIRRVPGFLICHPNSPVQSLAGQIQSLKTENPSNHFTLPEIQRSSALSTSILYEVFIREESIFVTTGYLYLQSPSD